MKRRRFLLNTGLLGCAPVLKPAAVFCRELTSGANAVSVPSRKIWLNYLQSLSEPVLKALSNDELLLQMPVEGRDAVQAKSRANFTHLEAFGRLLSGIAPWLQADLSNVEEKQLQSRYFEMAVRSIKNAVDPRAKDYLNWGQRGGEQPLVDASYVAYAFIRSPKLWHALGTDVQLKVIQAFKQTHRIRPVTNNWLLFAAMIEAFYITVNLPFDIMRLDYAVRQLLEWYKGDGLYADGPEFAGITTIVL